MKIAFLLAFATVTHNLQLPPGLLSAVCWVESNHKVGVINRNDGGEDSLGPCQMKLSTAKSLGYTGGPNKLRYHVHTNIFWAGKLLKYHLDQYDGDPRKAVAAYNAGKHRENKRGLTMNRKYVSKVFRAWSEDR